MKSCKPFSGRPPSGHDEKMIFNNFLTISTRWPRTRCAMGSCIRPRGPICWTWKDGLYWRSGDLGRRSTSRRFTTLMPRWSDLHPLSLSPAMWCTNRNPCESMRTTVVPPCPDGVHCGHEMSREARSRGRNPGPCGDGHKFKIDAG